MIKIQTFILFYGVKCLKLERKVSHNDSVSRLFVGGLVNILCVDLVKYVLAKVNDLVNCSYTKYKVHRKYCVENFETFETHWFIDCSGFLCDLENYLENFNCNSDYNCNRKLVLISIFSTITGITTGITTGIIGLNIQLVTFVFFVLVFVIAALILFVLVISDIKILHVNYLGILDTEMYCNIILILIYIIGALISDVDFLYVNYLGILDTEVYGNIILILVYVIGAMISGTLNKGCTLFLSDHDQSWSGNLPYRTMVWTEQQQYDVQVTVL